MDKKPKSKRAETKDSTGSGIIKDIEQILRLNSCPLPKSMAALAARMFAVATLMGDDAVANESIAIMTVACLNGYTIDAVLESGQKVSVRPSDADLDKIAPAVSDAVASLLGRGMGES